MPWLRIALAVASLGLGLLAVSEPRAETSAEYEGLWKRTLDHFNNGRYVEAEAAAKYLINRATTQFGVDHGQTARGFHELARVYSRIGRLKEAEQLARRAVAIRAKSHGVNSPHVAGSLSLLANVLIDLDRYAEAETTVLRSIRISERSDGPTPQHRGNALRSLGRLYTLQGRLAEAEELLRRALTVQEKRFPPDDIWVARANRDLAILLSLRGQAQEAERLFTRVTGAMEKLSGRDRSELGDALSALAGHYVDQGRHAEAEPIHKRAIAAYQVAHGTDNYLTAGALVGLGQLHLESGRPMDAEPLLRQALDIFEKTRGAASVETARCLVSLGNTLVALGRVEEAADLLKRALDIRDKVLGREHQLTAESVLAIGAMHLAVDRLEEAEPFLNQALRLTEKALGPEHLKVAQIHYLLGSLHLKAGRTEAALEALRRASVSVAARADQTAGLSARVQDGELNPRFKRAINSAFVEAVWRRVNEHPSLQHALLGEGLLAAQLAQSTTAGAAVNQMSARFAAGRDALADILRRGQDLANRWQDLERALTQGLGGEHSEESVRSTPSDRALVRKELDRLRVEIGVINGRLAKEFPDYAALARSDPLGVKVIQALLGPDEAAVVFLTLEKATFVWAVTKADLRWLRSELGTEALEREVGALRCGLDVTAWWSANSVCANLTGVSYSQADHASGKPIPFDAARAHALYKSLLGEAAPLVKGKQLLIVPSGALTTLPFHVLVTEAPSSKDLSSARWLIRDHAINVLPSVAALAALRRTVKPSAATKPMIGFGNPLLDGDQKHPTLGEEYKKLADMARAETGCAAVPAQRTATLRTLSRSPAPVLQAAGLADLAHLRIQSPLPETADELCDVARSMGADLTEIRIGARATEAEVKRLSSSAELAKYRILHFATHGTLAGQLSGTREPGLILTPAKSATAEDDGYLSASEIASLKLDADWVILSACNTAGGAGQGEAAEALSGLARVFFYAGARALLVSHWEVDSHATVKLVTTAIGALAKDKSLGRAEALRRAMLDVMADKSRPANWVPAWHPSVWAPFVVVGEGGAGR